MRGRFDLSPLLVAPEPPSLRAPSPLAAPALRLTSLVHYDEQKVLHTTDNSSDIKCFSFSFYRVI